MCLWACAGRTATGSDTAELAPVWPLMVRSVESVFWVVFVPLSVWNISGEILTATDLNFRIKSLGLRRSVILKSLDVALQEKNTTLKATAGGSSPDVSRHLKCQKQQQQQQKKSPLLSGDATFWPSELPLRTLLPFQLFSSYLRGIWPNMLGKNELWTQISKLWQSWSQFNHSWECNT